MYNRIFTVISTYLLSAFLFSFPANSAPSPTVVNQSPSEQFVGESFCFSATFSNTTTDIGYGPYYLLRLDPSLSFQSATFSGLPLGIVSNQTYPASGTLNDPISGNAITGLENGSLVALTIPVSSVSSSQPALTAQICLTVAANATPNVVRPNAISITPGFRFGDSATGVIGTDTVVGSAVANNFTPTVIRYSVSNTQPENEHPPGPAWTYPISAIADIASTATVTPITFPKITLPGNVKFTGVPSITGGVNCRLTPNAATLAATTGLGNAVDIDIACDSGVGSNGNSQDIRVNFNVYITDTLDNMTCNTTGAINTAKHLTLRKSALGTARPGSTITYTYAYQTSEFIPGLNTFTVTDALSDGISYSDIGGGQVQLRIAHGAVNTTLNVPFVDNGSASNFTNVDILSAITSAGGSIGAAQSGTISYTAVIDQTFNNGQPVLTRDTVTNSVTATYGISGAGNAQNCTETSSASVTIENISISKATIGSSTVKPGDVAQFQLTMSIPSGDANNVVLSDVLPLPVFLATEFPAFSGDLTSYPGSAAAGSFIEYAPGSAQPGNVTVTRSAASNSININFGNISSTTNQTVIINLYAKASSAPYADGLNLANLLNVTTNNTAVDNALDNTITQILVRAPDVAIKKEITSVTTDLDAGDKIDYRITLTNSGGADAFDVTVSDIFGSALNTSTCTTPVLTGGSGAFTGTLASGLTLNNSLGSANSGLGDVSSGNNIATLTFSCNINTGITANTLVENTGRLTFAAAAGQPAFPVRESKVSINTSTPSVVKTLVNSSESYTSNNELAVGEVARFRLVSTIPEGTHSSVVISDLLPPQLLYRADGSARLAFVGSSIASSGFANPGSCTYTTTNANITPDCPINASSGSFNAGDDPSFTLGTVTNSDSDLDKEFIVLEFNAVKVDSGVASTDFNNQGRHTDSSGNYDSTALALKRVDPVLTLNKAASNSGGDADDSITYTLTITAPASSPSTAFDITLADVLPTLLNYQTGSAAFGACAAGATTAFNDSDPNGTGITLTINRLAASESCIFSYRANVSTSATPGQTLTNTATLNWTSLDGAGSSLSGSAAGAEKRYQATSSANITVNATGSVKSIVSTSLSHTSETGTGASSSPRLLSIGEQIKYRLQVTVPEGTANNFVIRDNLPTGLEYINGSAAIALVSNGNLNSSLAGALCTGGTVNSTNPAVVPNCIITPTLGASGNSVDFNLANVVNGDTDGNAESIVVEFSALVKNQLSNQQDVNLSNQFEVLLSGTRNSQSAAVVARIAEPQLTLTSVTNPSPVDNRTDETPTFQWNLTLTNTGTAQAFQIQDGDSGNWQIQLPTGVENITALNVSSTGTVVDNSDLTTAINTTHFSISGADNNLLSINRNFAMAPAATLTISFNTRLKSSITPGSVLTINTDLDYAGQQTGGPGQEVRNFADISTGTGNNPNTSSSAPLNNYRVQAAVSVTTTTSTPVIGVAKELVSSALDATDGSFDLVYRLRVENSGDVALSNIQLTDDLAATFNPIASANINVTAVTSTDFTVNSAFNGVSNRQLINNTVPSTLAIGQTKSLDIAVTVSPGTNLSTFNNSVTATGQSARDASNTTTDTSVNGTDPDPGNDGPSNDTSVTPVTFAVNPSLGLAKAITSGPTNNGDGSYTLNYRFVLKNTGNINVSNVQIVDNLNTVFASATRFNVSALTSTNFTVNSSYNGNSDSNLLAANQSLAVGASGTVDLTVTVTPGTSLGPYNNSATATATSPNGNTSDTSDNGTNPETNNGSGGLDDATPVTFAEAPALGVAKAVASAPVNNGDDSYTLTYAIVVKNTGDIRLNNVQVVDDLATAFSGTSFSVTSVSATNGLATNGNFNGNSDKNLLAASQFLAAGASSTITLITRVTPAGNLGPYNNSATASGTSPSGASVNDSSDNGTNPETNNGSGGFDDVTPITFAQTPAIGIAKAVVANPVNNGDDSYTLTYAMVVKNTGDISLNNVQVVDDLATALSGTNFSVTSVNATNGLTANNGFNGNSDKNLLAASQRLAAGASSTITLVIRLTPGANLGPYTNSASASGTSPSGVTVNDNSDNGSNPETNNGSGGFDDVTPITFSQAPALGVAKSVVAAPINNGDGSYTLTYAMALKNTGDISLNNVQVEDDLATAFSGASYSITSISATNGLTTNSSFNGNSDKNLLAASQRLATGASSTVTLVIRVTPGANLGPYNNQVTASGTSPSGANVNDSSDNGTNPETNNGSGGFDDVTPITFIEAPAIGAAKVISTGPVNNNNGSYNLSYDIVVKNTGEVNLTNVQVTDDLASAFSGASYSVTAISGTGIAVNNSFNGSTDQNLVTNSQNLAVGARATITIALTVTPGANLGPYNNQATASGTSPSGARVSDLSDAGSNPEGNNGNGGIDDSTPVNFNEAPAIGIAKTISAAPVNNGDGSYTLSYAMVVRNNGDIDLNTIQVIEDFAATYPTPATVVVNRLTSADLTVNSGFNGYSDQNLLAANQSLATGGSANLTLTLTVTPSTNLGPYNNTAKVNGTSPSGAVIGDDSDNGTDPIGNNGSGGLNDPTPITFTEAPAIGIAKTISAAPVNNKDGSYTLSYAMVVRNNGDVPLQAVQVIEDFAVTYPAPTTVVVNSVSSNNATVNPNFNGYGDKNLFAANQSLATGASTNLTLTLTVSPRASLGPYNNTAKANASSPSGAAVSDDSDNGTDPVGNNGSGGLNDPTPIIFTEAPAIGVAKAVDGAVTNNRDGSYSIVYRVVVGNNGDVPLNNVQVIEDLNRTFVDASFTVGSLSSNNIAVNPRFNGKTDTQLVAANQNLVANTTATILVPVTIIPGTNLGPYHNSVIASGNSPSGTSVNDSSDNGTDPHSNNDSGGSDDVTTVTFVEAPALGIAKAVVGVPTNNGDGSYTLSYAINVKNTGDISLNNVQVVDDLSAAFSGANYSVTSVSATNGLNINSNFNGSSDKNLLAASQRLAANTNSTITLVIKVTPGTNLGPYNNSAIASGTSPSGAGVNDSSDNGTNPETNNGSGGFDDVTPITFVEVPAIGLAKALVAEPISNRDGSYRLSYQLNVENTGDIALSNVQIVDRLANTFPAPTSFVITSISAEKLVVNNDFNGVSDSNIFAANQSLAANASDTVTLALTVTPGENLGPYNNSATATGTSPSGADASDISDNGSNTTGNNGSGTEQDPTPVTFVEAPAIAVAKAMTNITNNGDGSYRLNYQFNLKNTGDITLSDVQVSDNLVNSFDGKRIYTVDSLRSANLVVNDNFNGDSDRNLLAANQTLAVAGTDVIDLSLTVTPAANLGPYNNSAQASGRSPSRRPVIDDSDNGLDPETDNGDGGTSDATPVVFTEAPAIGIAKSLVAQPVNNRDGSYQLSYQLKVANTGDITLNNVQVVENLSTTFPAPASFVINSVSANTLALNGNFDGVSNSELLAANQSLAVAASDTITLALTVTPGTNLGPYNNSVNANANSPSGASVSDISDNGSNTSGDNGQGTEQDPTPVTFVEAPAIGVAKTISGDIVPTTTGSAGNFDVPFSIVIENTGDVPLTNLQLEDDLAGQFGDAYVGLSQAPEITASSAQERPQLNANFAGEVFDGQSGRLNPGETINLSFVIELNPSADDAKGVLTNQARALGTSTGGQVVDDLSDSGVNATDDSSTGGDNPEARGNTAGGTDDPTPFELPAGSLQGVVWLDADHDDQRQDGETLLAGWTVQVLDANGNIVATVNTDENGFFLVDNLPQGQYKINFMTPTGTTFINKTVDVPANESVNTPIPVDPSGVVYDSITRVPVANAVVSILDENGVPLPNACLLANQQHQTTGEDGFYFFLFLLGQDPACPSEANYTLAVTAPPEQYQPSHSRLILPQVGALDPTGKPNPFALSALPTAPQIGDETTYYMNLNLSNGAQTAAKSLARFAINSGDPDVVNNHIPVDKIGVNPNMIRLTKRADSKRTTLGGLVRYTIQVENISDIDINNLTLIDQLPAGFNYVKNSVYTNDADGQLQVSSINPLTVSGIDVPAQESVELVYILRVGAGVARGKHINRVSPFLGDAPIGNEAIASVTVGADPDFEDVTILGKVFDDRDLDNWQDSANASSVFVQGGIQASSYVTNSTVIIDGNGERRVDDASVSDKHGTVGLPPLSQGLALGNMLGRSSRAQSPSQQQIIIRQELSALAFTDDLVLTTAEGSRLIVDRNGKVQRQHQGQMQQGFSSQNLTVERHITLLTNGNYQVDIVVQNLGIQEIGIPGVRVATVEGIYVETDLHGRFHLEGVDVPHLARGRNFYMKVDPATLPPQSQFVSENPRVKRITQGLPTRFDFAVQLASEQLGGDDKQVVIKLGELLFDDNSAAINSEYNAWLVQMADTINQYQGGKLEIIGQAHQHALAYQRAYNTYQALLPLVREDLHSAFSVELVEQVDESFAPVVNVATVTTLGKLLFDTDKSAIKAQYSPLLDNIAEQLIAAETGQLAITGFADSRASQDYNLALGLRRAKAVFKALKKRMPIEAWNKLTIKIQRLDEQSNTDNQNSKSKNENQSSYNENASSESHINRDQGLNEVEQ